MKGAVGSTFILALFGALAASALGQERPRAAPEPQARRPYEIVRPLQAIQDRIVLGSAEAKAELPKLLGQMAERLLAADPAVWKDAKNTTAAAVYVLSGGPPRVGRKIIELKAGPARELTLLEGALAYVEGREARAKALLLPIDAKALPAGAGGQLAMVQAALIAKEDPAKAFQLLDLARLLGPGTLVEEAALRREAFLAAEIHDLEKFSALATQYIRRFRKSVYADGFRRRFFDAAAQLGATIDQAQFSRLEKFLNQLDPAEQIRLYLSMAESGIVSGNVGAARIAAGEALRLSKEGGAEAARSRLYESAALILTNDLDKGLAELEAVDASHLPKGDAELKAAVIRIAREIRSAPDPTETALEPERGKGASGDGRGRASAQALIDLAQSALDQTDRLLKRTAP